MYFPVQTRIIKHYREKRKKNTALKLATRKRIQKLFLLTKCCIFKTLYLLLSKICNFMKSKKPILLPETSKILSEFGENLKMARLRRKLSTQQVSERANVTRSTLWRIEKGSPSVAIGTYVQVLFVLGLDKDLLKVATDDVLGRKLQDAELIVKKRTKKTK